MPAGDLLATEHALAACAELCRDPDGGGVWFCDLVETTTAEGMRRAVAAVLGVGLASDPTTPDAAERLKNERAAVDALRRWLRSTVEFVATKKGMAAALALAAHGNPELNKFSSDRLTQAIGALLERAVAAGEIRSDVSPHDLLRAVVGMCLLHDQPGWQSSVARLLDVLVDGLRVRNEQKGPDKSAGRKKKK